MIPEKPSPKAAATVKSPTSFCVRSNAVIDAACQPEPMKTVANPPMRSEIAPQICRLRNAVPSSTDSISAPVERAIPRSLQKATRCPCGIAMPGDFTRNADFSLPLERIKRALASAAGHDIGHFVNATRIATELLGRSIGGNMATFGLTYFLIGFGQFVFGGEPKVMITEQLFLPKGTITYKAFGGIISLQKLDIAAAVIASVMVAGLAVFFSKTRIGRALRAVADSHSAALSVGISLEQIWVIVWFAAGLVALVTGIMWGARSDVSFALDVIALKALPVLILGGLTSVPGAIVGGLIIGIGEKLWEFYWGPLVGGGTDAWKAATASAI